MNWDPDIWDGDIWDDSSPSEIYDDDDLGQKTTPPQLKEETKLPSFKAQPAWWCKMESDAKGNAIRKDTLEDYTQYEINDILGRLTQRSACYLFA